MFDQANTKLALIVDFLISCSHCWQTFPEEFCALFWKCDALFILTWSYFKHFLSLSLLLIDDRICEAKHCCHKRLRGWIPPWFGVLICNSLHLMSMNYNRGKSEGILARVWVLNDKKQNWISFLASCFFFCFFFLAEAAHCFSYCTSIWQSLSLNTPFSKPNYTIYSEMYVYFFGMLPFKSDLFIPIWHGVHKCVSHWSYLKSPSCHWWCP